jgi:hypothetical protein
MKFMSVDDRPKLEDYKSIDFTIIREPWNVYQLEENSEKIKIRWILTKLYGKPINTEYDFSLNHNQLVAVVNLPPSFFSNNININEINPNDYRNYIVEKHLSFNTISEEWNEYQFYLDDNEFRLRVKNGLREVHRTSIITNDREPLYLVDHGIELNFRKIE